MGADESRQVVERLWERFQTRDWETAALSLHEDFVADWPHTGERIRGRDNYIELNRNYPAPWSIELQRVVASSEEVVAEAAVTHPGGISYCAGFYELDGGKIRRATEYWVDGGAEAAPA